MDTRSARAQALLRALPAIALLGAVAIGGAVALLDGGEKTSVLDGRELARLDGPTWQTLADDSWMASTEAYVDDRLPGRAAWLTTHAWVVSHPLRDPVVDDVYLDGPGGTLLDRPHPYHARETLAEEGAVLAGSAAAAGADLLWVYAPRKEETYTDALPAPWASPYPAVHDEVVSALGRSGDVLDLSGLVAGHVADGDAFFRTDHHWTPATALDAVEATVDALAERGVLLGPGPTGYTIEVGPEVFYGSTGRRVTAGATAGDVFRYPVPQGGFAATMCLQDTCGLPTVDTDVIAGDTPYTNRYGAFLPGDHGLTVITDDSPRASGRVVLLTDSYGQAFGAYLAEHVSELYVIDERQYEGEPLDRFLAEVRPDVVLVLHNPVSLLTDAFDTSVWTTTSG